MTVFEDHLRIQQIRAQSITDYQFPRTIFFHYSCIAHARDIDVSANTNVITQRPAHYLLLFPAHGRSGIPLFHDRTHVLYLHLQVFQLGLET